MTHKNEGKRSKFLSTLNEAIKTLSKLGSQDKPQRSISFSEFVKKWEQKYARKHLGELTVVAYKHQLKNHVLPTMGHLSLEKIQTIDIVDFIGDLDGDGKRADGNDGGLSSATILHIYCILQDIFKRAVEWEFIEINPMIKVKRPKAYRQKEIQVYTEEEVAKLLIALERELPHWRIMITLALITGMRRGELLALEWKHVNLKDGIIEVRQSLSNLKGRTIIKEPKTKRSVRKVSIPSTLVSDLQKYYIHCRKKILDIPEHFFVFSTPDGKPYYDSVPTTWLKRFFKRTGLRPIRFHDLRHTSATLLINQGVHAKVIAERLGHADIRTTMNIYGHVLQKTDHAAASKLDSLLLSVKSDDVNEE